MNPYASLRGLPRDVWVLCAATFVNRLGSMAGPFLALYGTRVLGLGEGAAGLLVGAFGIGMTASAPLGGGLSDRFGAARVFLGALVGGGVLMLAFPFLRGLPVVLAGAFLWGLVAEAGRPSGMALLADLTPDGEHRRSTAAYRLALNLGMSVGPPLGGVLAAWSFTALFAVDAATALAAGVAVYLLLLRQRPGSERAPDVGAAGAPSPPAARPGFGAMVGAWRDRRLALFAIGFGAIWGAFTLQFGPLSVHLVGGLGYSTGVYGALVAVNTVLIVLCEVPMLARLARLSAARLVAAGGVLTAAGLALLALDTLPGIAAGVVVGAFGEMCAMGAAMPFVVGIAPEGQRGAYLGAYSLAASAAMAAGQSLGTAALGAAPAPVIWLTGAVLALAGTVLASHAARGQAV